MFDSRFDLALDRRRVLRGGALLGAAGLFAPRLAFAGAATETRFVFIIQRGAADGMGIVAPVGDPALAALRGPLAQDFADVRPVDGMFAFHPSLMNIAALYAARQALICQALATPYRDRSHFDAQNVLETGGARPYEIKDGWMNRLLPLIPGGGAKALAVSETIPAALRGPTAVASYAPSALPQAGDDLVQRIRAMYAGDSQLHGLWDTALATQEMAGVTAPGRGGAATGKLAASLMAGARGARVAMIETTGWDTHAAQRPRLTRQLAELDAMVGALKDGLGAEWADTLVIVATEFGRTAAGNGTGGTDHGTASMAMLLGGRVAGGRVRADWPGLGQTQLYESRDLRPTEGLDAVMAGALAEHFAIDPAVAMAKLFPNGGSSRAASGLVRA